MAKFSALYAHLDGTYARVGQVLKKGDRIGIMGNTGYSFGNHLHLCTAEGVWERAWYRDDYDSKRAEPSKTEVDRLAFAPYLFKYNGKWEKAYENDGFWCKREYGYHYASDLVTDYSYLGQTPDIYWNQDCTARVTCVENDGDAYGKFVVVTYDTADIAAPKKKNGERIHTVVSGDTLHDIATKYNVDLDYLIEYNSINKPDLIYEGDRIKIPNVKPKPVVVKAGDVVKINPKRLAKYGGYGHKVLEERKDRKGSYWIRVGVRLEDLIKVK